jgi:hypothetical protein
MLSSALPDCLAGLLAIALAGVLLASCAPFGASEPVPVPKAEAPAPVPSARTPAVPPPPAEPPATAADLATREMLAVQERARQMPAAELAKEIARLSDTPATPRTSFELALLLGQTRNNGDLPRALGLLDGLLRSPSPEAAPYQPLARLVATRMAEQRRLEEQVERQNQQARDSQRRIEQLNEKLEALKAIERSLTTRAASGAAPGASAAATPAAKGMPP